MFETNDSFEAQDAFLTPGTLQWKAMTLLTDLPIYLVTYEMPADESQTEDRTTAIATAAVLGSALVAMPPGSLVSLHCCIPGPLTGGRRGSWSLRQVHEVWQATPAEQAERWSVVFRDFDGQLFEPSLQCTVTEQPRELIARIELRDAADE